MTKDRITSRANPLVKRLRALAADRKARESEGLYLCEGEVMLGEALASEAAICDVLYAARTAQPLLDAAAARGAVLTAAADDIVSHCASVVSAQSVVFTVRIPAAKPCGSVERLLLLDGVADPGNAGTILRIADALSFDAVWLTGACVDPYAPKVVRSAMGARFRIPTISFAARADAVAAVRAHGLPLFGSTLSSDSVPLDGVDLSRGCIILGNEANGVSPELLAQCDRRVHIPMTGRAESLNVAVAAGILAYHSTQQRPVHTDARACTH